MVHTSMLLKKWKVDDVTGIVTVFTDQGQYTARKLVLTAGSWMPDIMPELQVRNIILASILSGLFVPYIATYIWICALVSTGHTIFEQLDLLALLLSEDDKIA